MRPDRFVTSDPGDRDPTPRDPQLKALHPSVDPGRRNVRDQIPVPVHVQYLPGDTRPSAARLGDPVRHRTDRRTERSGPSSPREPCGGGGEDVPRIERRADPRRSAEPLRIDPKSARASEGFREREQKPVVRPYQSRAVGAGDRQRRASAADARINDREMHGAGRESLGHRPQKERAFRDPVGGKVVRELHDPGRVDRSGEDRLHLGRVGGPEVAREGHQANAASRGGRHRGMVAGRRPTTS